MSISRRSFFAQAAASGAAIPWIAGARDRGRQDPSGLVTGKPAPMTYEELPGFLSKEQLRWHHESHYGGALSNFVRLDTDPKGEFRARTSSANSVLLHELYFRNMAAAATDPGATIGAELKKRFGAVDRWVEDFRAAAKSCRGWAVLCWHPVNGRLYNVATDSHEDGPVWSGVPIAVADTYEHAYYVDFKNRKADYVDAFTDHLDWTALEARLRACLA